LKNKVTYYTQDNCDWCLALEPHLRVFVSVTGVELETIDVSGNFKVLQDAGGTVTPHLTLDIDDGRFVLSERRVAAMIKEYNRIIEPTTGA
jgi:glutaredoxin